MNAGGDKQKGTPVSTDEVDRLKSLRALFDPASSLKVVDDFAKYLFTSAAVVGTLGGAAKVTGLESLDGTGDDLFSVAIILLGASLALAVLALLPLGAKPNPNKVSSLQSAIGRILRFRLMLISISGVLFATAVAIAGVAPFASKRSTQDQHATGITYSVSDVGKLEATAMVREAEPFTSAVVSLAPVPPKPRRITPRKLVRTDREGRATLTVVTSRTRRLRSFIATIRWRDEAGNVVERRRTVPLRRSIGP